jgi:hypothetical protein
MNPTSDTIRNVVVGSIHGGSLFPFQKANTTVKYDQPLYNHTSDIYTRRCPTQDSFYRTSSGNLLTLAHYLAVRVSPNTRARPASKLSGHKITFFQSGRFETNALLWQFPNTNSVFKPTRVRNQTRTHVYIQQFPNTESDG